MTGDERLAKVAEVLASLEPGWDLVKDCTPGQIGWASRLGYLSEAQSKAERFAPLLDEFRAEDEARALREAADTLWRIFLRLPHTPSPLGDYVQRKSQEFRRAALVAAEPDAGER